MSLHWDEFSKSLADESLPRRESLRRLGLIITATVLSPLGLEYAQAGKHSQRPKTHRPPTDPCKAFCTCHNKQQKNQCLAACHACSGQTDRLVGGCGNYVCCGAGQVSCGDYCAEVANDPYNCGACGYTCDAPGSNEYGGCLAGECVYVCVDGATDCNGACTFLGWDADNCGACGHVCGDETPYCNGGECNACTGGQALCDGRCMEISMDPANCGGCGVVCGPGQNCVGGTCLDAEGSGCPGVDLNWDSRNCGACGNVCPEQTACANGVCEGLCIGCY